MKASSVTLLPGLAVLLFELTVSAVFLNVSPNRQLFFKRDSVSLSCVDNGQRVDGWTVKRTAGGQTQTCDGGQQGFGRIDGSSCIVPHIFPSDSGLYWCESSTGQMSVRVNISVSDHSVILELPKPPLITGSDVTLCCKTRDGSTHTTFFFRNGSFIGTGLAGEFTIRDVQWSHEGFYSCSTGLFSRSSKRWLSVRDLVPNPDPDPDPDSDPDSDSPPLSVVSLLRHLVVVSLYCISTVLMVSIYCSKKTGNKTAVSMEMDSRVEGGQAEEPVYASADFTTEHHF